MLHVAGNGGGNVQEKILAYWLCNLPGIGGKKRRILMDYYGSLMEIFNCRLQTLKQVPGISEKDCNIILQNRNYSYQEEAFASLKKRGIGFVWMGEAKYPERLRHLADAPFCLYYRGNLPAEHKPTVAVVGARDASYESRELAGKFGRELAENGIQVISGLARGVDVTAQRGAMRIPSGRTYGVLGTGIDICYPREHLETYMQIIGQGGIISEYAPSVPGRAGFFAARNRIISGLSDGILIVEAGEKSGSLITAESGLEQGKEIFVLPGSILNPSYQGSNRLIQEGACLVAGVQDILDGLGIFTDSNITDLKKKIEYKLETPEKMVYAILSFDPVHISVLTERTGMPVTDVMEVLATLEQEKLIRMVGNHYYAISL